MACPKVVVVGFLVLVCVILSSLQVQAAVTCGDVVRNLSPCINYITGGGSPPPTCCSGVTALFGAARTTPDRQNVCRCIKSAINGISYTNFNLQQAATLPGKCGVNIPYKISPSTNCNNVK